MSDQPPDEHPHDQPVPAERPQLQPVEIDARPIVAAGTVGWLFALLLLGTVFHGALVRHHATWWLWACVAGAAFGLYGLYYVSHRR